MQREGQATPRLPPKPADAAAEDDEPWLFRFDRSLTTAEAWKMGFSHVILLTAQSWSDEAVAAAEICEAFRAKARIDSLGFERKGDIEASFAPHFLVGDVLLTIHCQDACAECMQRVAKVIDCVSNVWNEYNELEEAGIGAVVVVLEGTTIESLTPDWGADSDGAPVAYPVTHLPEHLAPYFA